MARIPRAEQEVRGTAARVPFRSAAGAQGLADDASRAAGDLAKGLEAVSADVAAITQVRERLQAEDDEREIKKLDVEYANALRVISFGDGTPGSVGFYGLQGQAAVDAFPNLQKQMNEARRAVLRGASNTLVRDMFLIAADDRDLQQRGADSRFLLTERERANDDISTARKATAASDAAHYFNDPKVLKRSLGTILAETFAAATRKGWSEEQYEAALREGQTVVVQSAFNAALAAEDYNSAKRIFDDHEELVDGAIRGEMLKQLRDGSVRIQAQALSTKCQALFPGDSTGGLKCIRDSAEGILEDNSLALFRAALQDVRLEAADERKVVTEARADATAAYNRGERERKAQVRKDLETAEQHIEGGGRWANLAAEVRAGISGPKAAALQERERQIARGEPIATDWDKYVEWTALTAGELANLHPAEVRPHLADPEFEQLRDMIRAARRGKLDPSRPNTLVQMVDAAANDIGLGEADKREERGRLISMFQQEVERAQEAKGKPLTSGEVRDILNGLVDDIVRVRGWTFGGLFSTTAEPFFEVDVPEDQRKQIIVDLTAAEGRRPTEAGIVREYLFRLNIPKDIRKRIITGWQQEFERDPTEAEIATVYSQVQEAQ